MHWHELFSTHFSLSAIRLISFIRDQDFDFIPFCFAWMAVNRFSLVHIEWSTTLQLQMCAALKSTVVFLHRIPSHFCRFNLCIIVLIVIALLALDTWGIYWKVFFCYQPHERLRRSFSIFVLFTALGICQFIDWVSYRQFCRCRISFCVRIWVNGLHPPKAKCACAAYAAAAKATKILFGSGVLTTLWITWIEINDGLIDKIYAHRMAWRPPRVGRIDEIWALWMRHVFDAVLNLPTSHHWISHLIVPSHEISLHNEIDKCSTANPLSLLWYTTCPYQTHTHTHTNEHDHDSRHHLSVTKSLFLSR